MAEKFIDPQAQHAYARRAVIAEPVFAHVKWVRGFKRFLRRGRELCAVEWSLELTAHNLLKLKRSGCWKPAAASSGAA